MGLPQLPTTPAQDPTLSDATYQWMSAITSALSALVGNLTPLAAPANVTTLGYPGAVRVNWNEVSGASTYKVFENTANTVNGATLIATVPANKGGTVNSTTRAGLNDTTMRYYFVQPVSGAGIAGSASSAVSGAASAPAVTPIPNLDNISDGTTYKRDTAANMSYRPLSNPLTASDTGSYPQVQIAAFTMRVAGLPDIAVNSGSVNGSNGNYGQVGYIYYDDGTFAGGTVAFQMTFTREVALQGAGRFFVGSIRLPASGASATIGNNDGGSDLQSRTLRIYPATYSATSWNNPANGIDLDDSTYSDATSSTSNLVYLASGFMLFTAWFSTINLRVISQVTAISSCTVLVEYSLNGGTTWQTLRSITGVDANPVLTTQALLTAQDTSKVQVRMTLPGGVTNSNVSAYCGTAVDDSGIGTQNWTNVTNAQGAPDGNVASAPFSGTPGSAMSHYLKMTNFGFSIPSSATIVGLACIVKRSGTTGNGTISDNHVCAVKGGTIQTSTDYRATGAWPNTLTNQSYGGSADMWGNTWAYSDINSSGFGFALSANLSGSSGTITASVDAITVTVYYTVASGASATGRVYSISQEVTY